jgi:hypothetical protein
VAFVISRTDKRLRGRDEIANSIGLSVLASLPVGHPADAAGWTKPLEEYEPGPTNAWRLRNALKDLGVVASTEATAPQAVPHSPSCLCPPIRELSPSVPSRRSAPRWEFRRPPSSARSRTRTSRLRCAPHAPCRRPRHRNDRATCGSLSPNGQVDGQPAAGLTIAVAVVNGKTRQVADTMPVTATVLGVSAGAATAEQLAWVALSAAADHREIAGIFVADPESADRTTGRVQQHPQPRRRRPPVRQSGIATEIRR